MKFLCVCEGGNVRSWALAYTLKDRHGQEAVAIGWGRVSEETLDYFCEWADFVVVMQACFATKISQKFQSKLRVLDVGPDRFGFSIHRELFDMVGGTVQEWADRGFKI